MQNINYAILKEETTGENNKTDYSFVNWIRFVAIISIVYEHCLDLHTLDETVQSIHSNIHYVSDASQAQAMPWIVQPLKFGTICFFIISGFLLGKHLSINDSPWPYYRRRLKIVGIPYLLAFSIYFLLNIHMYGIIVGHRNLSELTPEFLTNTFLSTFFFSSFWFIFVFLITLGILLIFWHQVNKPLFGWITGFIAAIYGINIYFNWFEQRHNLAMLAYVFYLWLGVWLSHNDHVLKRLQRLPNKWLIVTVLLLLYLAVIESKYLWEINSISPFNTVRFTNQIFSVAVFTWLLRNDYSSRLSWFNPRSESFGIYLYHLFFVELFTIWSKSTNVLAYQHEYTGFMLAGVTLSRWVIIYTLTLLFVKVVNRTRLRWIFGN